jgi:hypothetical protein
LRKPLAALALAAAAVAALTVPAGAATPTAKKPDYALTCRDGKHTAKVWLAPYRAVNNCPAHSGQWLVISGSWNDEAIGDDDFWATDVQPGASFSNKGNLDLSSYLCDPDHAYTDDGMCYPSVTVHLGQGNWCAGLPAGQPPTIYYRKNTKWYAPSCD